MPDSGKITVINADDWIIVFKDGKRRYEGHSIAEDELLRIAGVDFEYSFVERRADDEPYALENALNDPDTKPEDFARWRY